ncbi:MAG: hypothetical protein MZV63_17460, partial [Marinilabiliales bacterium]|nr:hypothetical protein [Marinilabiliales bacterium]
TASFSYVLLKVNLVTGTQDSSTWARHGRPAAGLPLQGPWAALSRPEVLGALGALALFEAWAERDDDLRSLAALALTGVQAASGAVTGLALADRLPHWAAGALGMAVALGVSFLRGQVHRPGGGPHRGGRPPPLADAPGRGGAPRRGRGGAAGAGAGHRAGGGGGAGRPRHRPRRPRHGGGLAAPLPALRCVDPPRGRCPRCRGGRAGLGQGRGASRRAGAGEPPGGPLRRCREPARRPAAPGGAGRRRPQHQAARRHLAQGARPAPGASRACRSRSRTFRAASPCSPRDSRRDRPARRSANQRTRRRRRRPPPPQLGPQVGVVGEGLPPWDPR